MGGDSQVDAVLTLMERVKTSNCNYDYIHFFQGSDLPIKTQDDIHDFFDSKKGIQFVTIEKNRTNMANMKCHYLHLFCHNRLFRKNKVVKALNFGLVYIQKALRFRMNQDIKLYQGSALFSITEDCAEYILSRKDEIKQRFRYSLAVDEVFIQSILMDSLYCNSIENIETDLSSNARLIDRTRPDGKNSPHIWRSDEFSYIITQPIGVCFARKFCEKTDYQIVEMIYDSIKNRS